MIPVQGTPVWLQVFFFLLLQCAVTLCSCPQRCYCTLRTVSCTSPNFPLILPTGILKLHITGNLGNLPKNSIVLPGKEQLKILTLKSARVTDINTGALSDHQLKEMIFNNVTFARISENAFQNSTVQTVYFRGSTIEVVAKGAFSGLTAEHIHMFLSNITTVESGAFKSVKLSEALTFSLCHLSDIRESAFNVTFPLMMSMNTFDHFEADPSTFVMFSYNRLNCTCDSAWLWSPKYDYSEDLSYNKCISPASLKNVYLDEVNPYTLCHPKNT